jgi:hypothetical protein
MSRFLKTVLLFSVVIFPSSAAQTTLRPAKPTHYFYVPTAYLNNEFVWY